MRLPFSTYTSRIIALDNKSITVERLVETGYETLKMPLPCLLTVVKEISYPRLPTLRGKQRARRTDLPIWGPEHLDADESLIGLKGSPTKVVKIQKPKVARKVKMVDLSEMEPSEAASELADFLEEKNLL